MSLLLAAALSLASAAKLEKTTECPEGTHRVMTSSVYAPFKCEKDGKEAQKGFGAVSGPQGFKFRPKCPRGSRPVSSGEGALQQYRCVRASAGDPEPELAPLNPSAELPEASAEDAPAEDPLTRGCPPGKRKVRTTDPLRPFQCVSQATRVTRLGDDAYRRWTVPGELAFEYPKLFRPQDNWKDEVPTLVFTLDEDRGGKPVTITLSRVDHDQPTYQDVDSAIAKDKEWQGAADGGTGRVGPASIPARFTYVVGETRTAYIPFGKDAYYLVVYSAPSDSYESMLPAFNRLLKTLVLLKRKR
ncbi:MAG: hypothetical protein SF051_11715 [Elusimicrobiota bacterium]|nr:hypothetical protein [Elusimicrobiota bacterium]